MSYRITLEYPTEDALSRMTYRFWLRDDGVVLALTLDSVIHEDRPSKRHGWRITAKWDRLSHRERTMERPQVPANVLADARAKLNAALTFA